MAVDFKTSSTVIIALPAAIPVIRTFVIELASVTMDAVAMAVSLEDTV